ncbi:MAG TPA: 4-(cytidine 5'-diphospho)-2-C-methyl-D-erythritol kinase [Rhodospirillales bacterium]|nr:4-(cytidine 5'-diphospho)-2-C-methyl-D-erythritol kinase [Rhodospirillales bacterium]
MSDGAVSEAGAAVVAALAPAKVNLYLHVLGRRADGYHLLDSLVVFTDDVGDRIEVRPADELRFEVEGPFAADVPAGGDNLVVRAARALAAEAGRPARAAIRLEKRLPVAAGVGGGSADAAATLRALSSLWGVRLEAEALGRIALGLGADVPMCLHGRPVHVAGIGEMIEPAPALPTFGLLLVNPRIPLPTPPVFARRAGPFSEAARLVVPPQDPQVLAALLAERRNDLTDAAVSIVPAVADVLGALAALPDVLLARMSGSGATCFGLCADLATARAAAASLAAQHPAWWITAAAV